MTFTNDKYCPNVTYGTEKARESLYHLYTTGANWVSIVVTQYQLTFNSTTIFPLYTPIYTPEYTYLTATPADLSSIIDYSHSLSLSVMLKPQIDLTEDPTHWRGDIGTNFTDTQWLDWFASYGDMLLEYTQLAETHRVEMVSLSCELITASAREKEWRELIAKVRKIYSGKLTDSANWGYLNATGGEATNKTWWDAVDQIGIDAYYPLLDNVSNPTMQELIKAWEPAVERGRNLTSYWKRPLAYTEIGYCSGGCQHEGEATPRDLREQQMRYEAVFMVFEKEDWFKGVFWWNWPSDPAYDAHGLGRCLPPMWKPAEFTLRDYYGATLPIPEKPSFPQVCACVY